MSACPPCRRRDPRERRGAVAIRRNKLPWLGCLGALLLAVPAFAASPPATEAADGMIVSSQRDAAKAGIEILELGGNAIDAAVAVGYAEAVTNPCCGNIGGGGVMTAHLADGRSIFLDFRETAPHAATAAMYQDYRDAQGKPVAKPTVDGWPAVAVPGTVLGLDMALTTYGTLPRAVVMAPAIRLARDGFELTRGDTDIIDLFRKVWDRDPNVARRFLRADGSPLQPGDKLVQRDLADTLAAIAAGGPDAFYRGRIPEAVEAASRDGSGLITAADFDAYRITQGPPLSCGYRGYTVLTSPPPSGGLVLCEILSVLAGYDLHAMGFHSARSVHVMVEAMRHAYLDRNTYLADPAFARIPLQRLLSPDHAAAIRAQIGPKASPSKTLIHNVVPDESPDTTHYSVIDKAGNAVAVTYTINRRFGAGVVAGDTGFLLNNEMGDFTLEPGTVNSIAPGKRPLSSMSPTIVLRDGRVVLVVGSPGGQRIITIVLQSLLNMLDHHMAAQEAVDAPRLHHQWKPDKLFAEPYALSPDTQAALQALGYEIATEAPWGGAALIAVPPVWPSEAAVASSGNDVAASGRMRPGLFYGANDSRRPAGAAIGYDAKAR